MSGRATSPIHAMKYSLDRGSQNFHRYRQIDRSLKPLLMRPSLALVRKAFDRMWFRRHWYWPSGYIVVGIIVALLTNNIHLSSLSGILLSILAVLLWPFILGAALCRLLGFHIPGIDIT
jgi:predicted permease